MRLGLQRGPLTPIRTVPQAQLMLTEDPEETMHRVASVLKYLAASELDSELADDDVEFGRHVLPKDLAAALEHAAHAQRVAAVECAAMS